MDGREAALQHCAEEVETSLRNLLIAADGDEAQAGEILDACWKAARLDSETD